MILPVEAPGGSVVPFACLPWYALPETEAAQDALWGVIGRHMRRAGIDAPETLARDVAVPAVFTDPISFSRNVAAMTSSTALPRA